MLLWLFVCTKISVSPERFFPCHAPLNTSLVAEKGTLNFRSNCHTKEMDDMDDSVPSVCQGCRKIYSGGFTKLEQFAGKWMCPSCIDIERKKAQAAEETAKRKRDAEQQRAAAAAIAPTPSKPTAPAAPKVAACKTCGGVVAIGAKTCPHCGQSKPAPKPPTQVTKKHLIVAGLIVVFFFVVTSNQKSSLTVLSPEMSERENKIAQYGEEALLFARKLKAGMREPESLVVEYAYKHTSGDSETCIGYQARNGFGGMNRAVAMLFQGKIYMSENESDYTIAISCIRTDYFNKSPNYVNVTKYVTSKL